MCNVLLRDTTNGEVVAIIYANRDFDVVKVQQQIDEIKKEKPNDYTFTDLVDVLQSNGATIKDLSVVQELYW